ncbi:hypothetical protein [Legionella rowbothamii]|uniref:hypothetical protein n=1 Tax=Legionella rowbothamii TaxID=96229 RepID=UPI00105462E1|nr:hypothetical protein [Legionella rowbothamii]
MRLNKALFLSIVFSCNAFATTPTAQTSLKYPVTKKIHSLVQARLKSLKHSNQMRANEGLATAKQLGMNNIPVFDQGDNYYDSAYASTAAIDALLGRGDYISQLCFIQLGNYMDPSNKGFGFTLHHSLSRLENYGYIRKVHQKGAGCEDPDTPFINYETYNRLSRDIIGDSIMWFPLLNLHKSVSERVNTEKTLIEIKKAINQEHRATMGFLAFYKDGNRLGTMGSYHEKNDTWILNAQMKRDLYNFPTLYYRSVIITGYDNDAISVDEMGEKHKGLLTLRGSWGSDAGDQGDFYMSYDYFRVLVLEAQQIVRANFD